MAIPASVALNAYANAAKMGGVADGGPVPVQPGAPKFEDVLKDAVGDVVSATKAAEGQAARSVAKEANIVDVVTAISEAEATLETVMSIRDRVISAYQEILRMPV